VLVTAYLFPSGAIVGSYFDGDADSLSAVVAYVYQPTMGLSLVNVADTTAHIARLHFSAGL
jgi:hypothetical protein